MAQHTHHFVETYQGLVGFGLDRLTNESTLIYYLQKFSDDALIQLITKRMDDAELTMLFDLISDLLRKHLSEEEYHAGFLKETKPASENLPQGGPTTGDR